MVFFLLLAAESYVEGVGRESDSQHMVMLPVCGKGVKI